MLVIERPSRFKPISLFWSALTTGGVAAAFGVSIVVFYLLREFGSIPIGQLPAIVGMAIPIAALAAMWATSIFAVWVLPCLTPLAWDPVRSTIREYLFVDLRTKGDVSDSQAIGRLSPVRVLWLTFTSVSIPSASMLVGVYFGSVSTGLARWLWVLGPIALTLFCGVSAARSIKSYSHSNAENQGLFKFLLPLGLSLFCVPYALSFFFLEVVNAQPAKSFESGTAYALVGLAFTVSTSIGYAAALVASVADHHQIRSWFAAVLLSSALLALFTACLGINSKAIDRLMVASSIRMEGVSLVLKPEGCEALRRLFHTSFEVAPLEASHCVLSNVTIVSALPPTLAIVGANSLWIDLMSEGVTRAGPPKSVDRLLLPADLALPMAK